MGTQSHQWTVKKLGDALAALREREIPQKTIYARTRLSVARAREIAHYPERFADDRAGAILAELERSPNLMSWCYALGAAIRTRLDWGYDLGFLAGAFGLATEVVEAYAQGELDGLTEDEAQAAWEHERTGRAWREANDRLRESLSDGGRRGLSPADVAERAGLTLGELDDVVNIGRDLPLDDATAANAAMAVRGRYVAVLTPDGVITRELVGSEDVRRVSQWWSALASCDDHLEILKPLAQVPDDEREVRMLEPAGVVVRRLLGTEDGETLRALHRRKLAEDRVRALQEDYFPEALSQQTPLEDYS